MIRPLRKAHGRIWIVLALAMYAVLIAGLVSRRSATPPNSHLEWSKIDER
jgi:hypothetical protein